MLFFQRRCGLRLVLLDRDQAQLDLLAHLRHQSVALDRSASILAKRFIYPLARPLDRVLHLLAGGLQLLLLLEDVLLLVLHAVSDKKALQILVELPFHDAFERLLKGPKRSARLFDKLARPSPIAGGPS